MKRELLKIFHSNNPAEIEEKVNEWRSSGNVSVVGEPLLSTTSVSGALHITMAFFYTQKENNGRAS